MITSDTGYVTQNCMVRAGEVPVFQKNAPLNLAAARESQFQNTRRPPLKVGAIVMPFLHIFLNAGRTERYEFGFNAECPPCVGDVVDLFFREPGTTDADAEILECRVVKRQWFLRYYSKEDDECELTVETDDPIPDGYVPDSEAWPSETWTERKSLLRQITEV